MSLRTAFTSTAGLGDTAAGHALGAAVVGLGTLEAVTVRPKPGLRQMKRWYAQTFWTLG
jgi:hypothetical protein